MVLVGLETDLVVASPVGAIVGERGAGLVDLVVASPVGAIVGERGVRHGSGTREGIWGAGL